MNVRAGAIRGNQNRQNSNVQSNVQEFHDDEERSPWLLERIRLNKGSRGYGFAFIFDKSRDRKDDTIAVTKIVRGGVAHQDGRLKFFLEKRCFLLYDMDGDTTNFHVEIVKDVNSSEVYVVNDIIVSVNNVNLDDIPYVAAIETLRNTGPNMTLVVRRLKDNYHEREVMESKRNTKPMASPSRYEDNATESEDEEDNTDFYQFQVHLTKKSTGGLGIHISGGYDEDDENEEDSYIFISKLAPNGVADIDGNIRVGDIILQVDNISLHRATHERAMEILQNTGRQVTLFMGRFIERKSNATYQQINKGRR